jgi:hypothetical protein
LKKEFAQEYDGTTAKLTIPDGYVEDSGDWLCEAWNEAGEATQNVRVTIKGTKNIDFKNTKTSA